MSIDLNSFLIFLWLYVIYLNFSYTYCEYLQNFSVITIGLALNYVFDYKNLSKLINNI